MSGGVELARCDFCCEVKPIARQYLHAKNADQFAIVRFCGDCGCAESEQLAETAQLTEQRRVLVEALEAQEAHWQYLARYRPAWDEAVRLPVDIQRRAALEMCRATEASK